MVCIRGDHINFDNYTLFDLIESYWDGMYKFQRNRNWRYTSLKTTIKAT